MCVDSNGDLWVACFYGAKVGRLEEEEEEEHIRITNSYRPTDPYEAV